MKKLLVAVAAGVAMGAGLPAVAAADPTVDAAVTAFHNLGLPPLTAMPDNRQVYRTYDDYNNDMQALATANPSLVAYKLAPNKSIEGRDVHYVEITNNVNVADGKPVDYVQGAIHGNESAAAEDSMEFAIDIVNQAKVNPKVSALLDHVRVIIVPLVNPDGYAHTPSPRRANCDSATPLTPPLTCPTSTSQGVDMNRNYPLGWGSNIGVSFAQRGSGPGSEPEVKNTMSIIASHQVTALITAHTNERAIFYPPFDLNAGDTPELNTGYKALAQAMLAATNNGYTNTRDSAHDYETSGETNDWSYYATRGFGFTQELIGPVSGCPQALPNYLNCTTADWTGHAGPTSTAAQTSTFEGHPVRDAWWTVLEYASLPAGHSVIGGTAVPGATLKITKDFTLYTAPVKQNTTPATSTAPIAVPTHLESSMTVPASGKFTWDTNPSVRPQSAYYADGEHTGPNGFVNESYTLTCTAANGTLLGTTKVLVDKGDVANVTPCTTGDVGGSVAATLALTLGAPASFGAFTPGVAKDYTASTTATVISTAGDATLSVADPSSTATGHLVNGTFSLPSALQASAGGTLADVGGSAAPTLLKTWSTPVSNDVATVTFGQHVGAADALRTGAYTKTLTFTLSTTTP
ncbi:M14 family zinc carboxypeptidase [Solirubrobacter ginsenosidimutans]|uniref:M14 family zinc carboxypeptidase n=1 Tax=Solirubrobacter ginsenosidimutans TaxID=490573 RepID=A0A9X3MWA9_9ACTN|nr:M14 family zinc carboxypeptidase [Solirubrobacter ginsenosidimutans]MDA0164091.1 M14 family zinc carboxypeptidase [Solirubrobacter ginsenosidimutans]